MPFSAGDVKIVYVVESMGISGGVKVIVEHAEGLSARGHDVSILTKHAHLGGWIPTHVPVVNVPRFDAETLPSADIHVATWFPTVVPTLKAGKARSVFHLSQGYEAIYPAYAHRKDEIDEAYSQKIPKLLISRHLLDLFAGRFPGPYHLLPQVVDARRYAPRVEKLGPAAPPTIGVVGPFEAPNKGIPVSLEAVNRLRARDRTVHLWRASQMPLLEEERLLSPPDRYLFSASVADMVDFYAGLDILLHPSFEAEGFPLPPLEAMASGVPVVLTSIPSFDPIPDGAVSRVAPGDSASMAGEAERLLQNAAFWRNRRRRGLEVAATFRLDRALNELERIFAGG